MNFPPPNVPDDYVSIKRSPDRKEIEFVMKHGHSYEPAVLPDDVPRGRLGWCFDDSMIASAKTEGKYRYVEGIAQATPGEPWVLHAWVTDDGVHAYDPTWYGIGKGEARGMQISQFIGIEMELQAVMEFVRATEYQGIIPNRWRHPQMADRALYSIK